MPLLLCPCCSAAPIASVGERVPGQLVKKRFQGNLP